MLSSVYLATINLWHNGYVPWDARLATVDDFNSGFVILMEVYSCLPAMSTVKLLGSEAVYLRISVLG